MFSECPKILYSYYFGSIRVVRAYYFFYPALIKAELIAACKPEQQFNPA